jgi:ABC-type lipoprotein export system ATPase subunit
MIRIADLHFWYREGDFALRVNDLRIDRGETIAVIGPSGSGKTTLLNLIAGIALPQAGCVTTNGVEIAALDDSERREFRIANVGLVFQEFELLEYLSVLDNILLPYRFTPALRLDRAVRGRAEGLARQVGIADKLGRLINRLSHGERQRVAVCRALLTQPTLLLADEPTGNLDPANRDLVLDFLFDHSRSTGATLVTVTHDHDLLGRFARVIDVKDFLDAVPQPPPASPRGDVAT